MGGVRFVLVALLVVLAAACAPSPTDVVDPAAALREAAGRGDTAAVRTLLEQGAPVDARDDQGATALAPAERSGQREVASILRAAGAAG